MLEAQPEGTLAEARPQASGACHPTWPYPVACVAGIKVTDAEGCRHLCAFNEGGGRGKAAIGCGTEGPMEGTVQSHAPDLCGSSSRVPGHGLCRASCRQGGGQGEASASGAK